MVESGAFSLNSTFSLGSRFEITLYDIWDQESEREPNCLKDCSGVDPSI